MVRRGGLVNENLSLKLRFFLRLYLTLDREYYGTVAGQVAPAGQAGGAGRGRGTQGGPIGPVCWRIRGHEYGSRQVHQGLAMPWQSPGSSTCQDRQEGLSQTMSQEKYSGSIGEFCR